MKIFILDDCFDRQEFFKYASVRLFGADVGIVIADSFDNAVKAFDKHKEFDLMFLDHDLGDRVYIDSDDPNTGYQVAKYMIENGITSKEIIIHSMNYAGAHNIVALFPEHPSVKYVPYTLLKQSRLPDSPVV